MRLLFTIIFILGIFACNDSEKKKTIQKKTELNKNSNNEEYKILVSQTKIIDSTQIDLIKEPTKPQLILIGLEKEIAEIGISFHKWYIENTNEYNPEIPTDFTVTKAENDSCLVDYEPYFNELRKLGTISVSFMQKEKERTKLCAETIKNMKWSEYIGGFPENCDDYLYWTNSQDITDGVEVVGINKEKNNWIVSLSLYAKDKNGKKYFGNNIIKVTVIKENEKYLISEINWIIK